MLTSSHINFKRWCCPSMWTKSEPNYLTMFDIPHAHQMNNFCISIHAKTNKYANPPSHLRWQIARTSKPVRTQFDSCMMFHALCNAAVVLRYIAALRFCISFAYSCMSVARQSHVISKRCGCQHLGRHDRAAKVAMWPTTKPARKLTTAPMRMQGA